MRSMSRRAQPRWATSVVEPCRSPKSNSQCIVEEVDGASIGGRMSASSGTNAFHALRRKPRRRANQPCGQVVGESASSPGGRANHRLSSGVCDRATCTPADSFHFRMCVTSVLSRMGGLFCSCRSTFTFGRITCLMSFSVGGFPDNSTNSFMTLAQHASTPRGW
jgi:hypothetical protein